MVVTLAKTEWFTPHIPASALFHVIYPQLSPEEQQNARQYDICSTHFLLPDYSIYSTNW